jgi:hypothetical protein
MSTFRIENLNFQSEFFMNLKVQIYTVFNLKNRKKKNICRLKGYLGRPKWYLRIGRAPFGANPILRPRARFHSLRLHVLSHGPGPVCGFRFLELYSGWFLLVFPVWVIVVFRFLRQFFVCYFFFTFSNIFSTLNSFEVWTFFQLWTFFNFQHFLTV